MLSTNSVTVNSEHRTVLLHRIIREVRETLTVSAMERLADSPPVFLKLTLFRDSYSGVGSMFRCMCAVGGLLTTLPDNHSELQTELLRLLSSSQAIVL